MNKKLKKRRRRNMRLNQSTFNFHRSRVNNWKLNESKTRNNVRIVGGEGGDSGIYMHLDEW